MIGVAVPCILSDASLHVAGILSTAPSIFVPLGGSMGNSGDGARRRAKGSVRLGSQALNRVSTASVRQDHPADRESFRLFDTPHVTSLQPPIQVHGHFRLAKGSLTRAFLDPVLMCGRMIGDTTVRFHGFYGYKISCEQL